MRRTVARSGGFAPIMALLFTVVAASPAQTQDRSRYKEQLQAYTDQLDQFAEKDEWGVSSEVRQRARKWLEDAKVLLASGDTETAGLVLKQVGDASELIEALITKKKLEASARKQEESYYKRKEKTIPKIENEIERLRNRKRKLERRLEQLRSP